MKHCIIIADFNGAGETTFVTDLFPQEGRTVNFLNADLIAAGGVTICTLPERCE
jgi:predicted ABC-type ATPase